jgi:hypothetical protein
VPEQNDTSDTSGVTGGDTLGSDTADQNANMVPSDAGVTEQDRTARGSGSGTVNPNPPMGQTPPVDDSEQTGSASSDQPPSSLNDTATGTGTTNSGTNTENAGTGGGAGTQQPRPPR